MTNQERNLPLSPWSQQARVMVSALEAAGIPATLADFHFISVYPHLEYGASRPRVFVPPALAEEAREIVDEARARPLAPLYPCPSCGGPTRRRRNLVLIAGVALLGTFFPFFLHSRRCGACRTNFTPPPPEPFTKAELGYDPDGPAPSLPRPPSGPIEALMRLRTAGLYKG